MSRRTAAVALILGGIALQIVADLLPDMKWSSGDFMFQTSLGRWSNSIGLISLFGFIYLIWGEREERRNRQRNLDL